MGKVIFILFLNDMAQVEFSSLNAQLNAASEECHKNKPISLLVYHQRHPLYILFHIPAVTSLIPVEKCYFYIAGATEMIINKRH